MQVNNLSALYGVSTVTIRNNLAFLKKQKIAVRAYSSALICNSTTPSVKPSVKNKSALNTAIKRSVAKAAVKLIQPSHQVILNSKTTTFKIARLMRKHTNVIAITNSINVANALLKAKSVKLLITSKHLRRQSQSFYSNQAKQSLQNYHFNMLFLSVNAINLKRSVSTHNKNKARLNRQMCKVAKQIIVVTNSSKFNRSSLHKIINTQRINIIIVNKSIPANSLKKLQKAKVKVILVKK